MCQQGLLERREADASYSRKSFGTLRFAQINLLARVISPTLEVYYLTLALLARSGSKTIPKAELEKRCQLMAQRVAMIHEINSPDYSDKNLIANFIDTLIHIDYVKVYGTEDLAFSEVFQRSDKRIRLLLSRATRSNIMQMLGQAEKSQSAGDDEEAEHIELELLAAEDKKLAKAEDKLNG
jgi:glycerol-3-phosphate O-acyltransferase